VATAIWFPCAARARSSRTARTHTALFAQSIGGGGGSGGFSVTGSVSTQGSSVGAAIGGGGAGGGSGGDVEAISLGDAIMTTGARSYGIVAQSIGGGGGDGGSPSRAASVVRRT
jgi:hypothetical protein